MLDYINGIFGDRKICRNKQNKVTRFINTLNKPHYELLIMSADGYSCCAKQKNVLKQRTVCSSSDQILNFYRTHTNIYTPKNGDRKYLEFPP